MANILFLSYFFTPDSLSTAVLMSQLAQDLQAKGHNVTVLTTTPHYNLEDEALAKQPLRKKWGMQVQESTLDGMRVLHVQVAPKGSKIWLRLFDYLRYHGLGTIVGATSIKKPDVMFVPSPPLTMGIHAWLLRLIHRRPFVYNVQEIYPDVAVKLGVITNKRVIKVLEWMEMFIYKRSRRVSVISEWFKEVLVRKGVDPERVVVIPNFVDVDFVSPMDKRNPFSEKYGLTETFNVLYAGNLGLTQDWESLLSAAETVTDLPDMKIVIVGGGAKRNWLDEQITARQLDNVLLLPYQPREWIPFNYATADLCIIPMKAGMTIDTFPSKIYTIMAAARPALVSADPNSELKHVIENGDCGWVATPDDVNDLADKIRVAYDNRDDGVAKGERGRAYVVANHSRAAVVEKYHQLFLQIESL